MARKLYIGVDDKARRIKRAYIGDPSSFYLTAENFCDHSNLINQGVTFSGTSPSGGSCLYFNGSSRILIPSMAELGSTNWTIDWREYPTVATTGSRFSSSYTTDSGTCGGILLGYSNSRVYASTGADITNWDLVAGANMFSTTANTWTHWAVVKNGTSLKTYRNGTLYASTTCNGNIGVSSKYYMALGDYRAGDHSYFTGYIDYFRISNHARWTGNFTAPTGKASGVARRVKKIYLGVNGVAKLIAEMKRYTVVFDGNGATSGSKAEWTTGDRFISPQETFTCSIGSAGFSRSGYRFLGWNTKADGSGTIYQDNGTIQVSGDMRLYAQWVQVFTLSYYKSMDASAAGGTDKIAQYFSDVFEAGPTSCVAAGITIPTGDKAASYGKTWTTTINTGMAFSESSSASPKRIELPVNTKIAVWAKNHYVGDSGVGAYNHCDIRYNGGTAGSTGSGTEVYYEFTATKNCTIHFEWDMQGTPWINWPTRLGSSWWDIDITH